MIVEVKKNFLKTKEIKNELENFKKDIISNEEYFQAKEKSLAKEKENCENDIKRLGEKKGTHEYEIKVLEEKQKNCDNEIEALEEKKEEYETTKNEVKYIIDLKNKF